MTTKTLKQYTPWKKVHFNKKYVKKWSLAMNLRQANTHSQTVLSLTKMNKYFGLVLLFEQTKQYRSVPCSLYRRGQSKRNCLHWVLHTGRLPWRQIKTFAYLVIHALYCWFDSLLSGQIHQFNTSDHQYVTTFFVKSLFWKHYKKDFFLPKCHLSEWSWILQ